MNLDENDVIFYDGKRGTPAQFNCLPKEFSKKTSRHMQKPWEKKIANGGNPFSVL